MIRKRPTAGRPAFLHVAALASVVMIAAAAPPSTTARAADEFPYERMLLLDVAPMPPLKRVPILTVEPNGSATIELWCRTAKARVQVSENAIRIEIAPLSEALPQYMGAGQCSDARVQADAETLQALAEVTQWRRRGDGVELAGPATAVTMRFRASSH
ncbi:MAG: hypothetical protein Q8M24_17610 [Pseudolabrys sp.]|nr:hypothetical protein [Pseudolabrys sp.]MDP2297264.1 hypothetical protein [Pseudolabrys sp.]